MNERIRELHNRACRLDMEQYPNAIPDGERVQQKFAELILTEVIGTIYRSDISGRKQEQLVQELGNKFGLDK